MEIKINGKIPYECTSRELHEAFEELRKAQKYAQQKCVINFFPGLKVSFIHKGQKIVGVVETINKTTVTVKPDVGFLKWNVGATLLTLEP